MKKTFNLVKTEKGLQKGFISQTFSCSINPVLDNRMAELDILTPHKNVEDAVIAYFDMNGKLSSQQSLLVIKGKVLISVLHVPPEATELRISLSVPAKDELRVLTSNLSHPGKITSLFKLALYVYKVSRLRGVTFPRFLLEKSQQLYRLGLRNLFDSPSSHVDLRESAELEYKIWIKNSTEYFLGNGSLSYPMETTRISIFLKFLGNRGDLQNSLLALSKLKVAAVNLYLLVMNEEAKISLNKMLEEITFPTAVLLPHQIDQVINTVGSESEWCCFLREGDVIREHAIYVLNRYVLSKSITKIFYSDHDFLEHEERCSPWFKPVWNREYYLNFDYIGRAVFYKANWVAEQGIIPDASYAHERFILKLGLTPKPLIELIPDVLFSFPALEPMLKNDGESKRQRVISEGLDSKGIAHIWRGSDPGRHAAFVEYRPSSGKALPLVSLIIPTRDQSKLFKNCLDSILENTDYPDFEIIIVDNGSTEPRAIKYLNLLSQEPSCTVLNYDKPFNYSAINNLAAQNAKGELIGLINNDIEVKTPSWLRDMASYFWSPDVGIVGAKLLYRDKRVQHAGIICGLGNVAGHAHRFFKANESGYMNRLQAPNEFSAVTGACLLTRRSLYAALGGLNNHELAVAYNDVDYCLRVKKAGYRIVYAPQAELFHYESKTRGSEDTSEKKQRYEQERSYMWENWRLELQDDGFYNPNLTRVREDFSIGNRPKPLIIT